MMGGRCYFGATTLAQMEMVFGDDGVRDIANHVGHVMAGTGGGYGLKATFLCS
jgi:hypothetical protein